MATTTKSKNDADLSESHKQAMAEGRRNAKAVREYLDALRATTAPKKRGRKRSPDAIRTRLDQIQKELSGGELTAIQELHLHQERIDLETDLEELEKADDMDPAQYEAAFIECVKPYSEAKGITYTAWRQMGVPARVLRAGNVGR